MLHGKAPADSAATQSRNGRSAFELIRYAHVFASAVRERLEIDLLREANESLSLSQFHLLRLIALNGQHQIGEVADFLGVTPPAATKAIDKLEGLGLVKRSASALDRRVTLLSATRRSRDLVTRYEALEKDRLTPILAGFTAEEVAQFTRLLQRFALGLVAHGESHDGLCLRCSAYFDEHCPVHHITDNCPYQRMMTGKSRERAAAEA